MVPVKNSFEVSKHHMPPGASAYAEATLINNILTKKLKKKKKRKKGKNQEKERKQKSTIPFCKPSFSICKTYDTRSNVFVGVHQRSLNACRRQAAYIVINVCPMAFSTKQLRSLIRWTSLRHVLVHLKTDT